ncbi:bifunctional 2-keto-4-hydroxyglutarate aldolase/2-keto-3-deoxy-6-phosphogluconate aldolase [Noviherbaspirillum sp. Root189]|uniref:bifunctional 2-keto-4-hydroxyglutarate aldolase/2-keto-3-deoxy-6-phosphogluconate aldolase n=1 Tax=Noviherbaspirillum sp. Root189 TaxID=1736487 RepID=UPI00070C593F|nr:bifunctional 2-keto-4-hydroxyglutarate aldolase/2-keto-3-deoxy-6-phosphogluconate aldolase [Noviherbaspirillum sp. Root189]KRB83475.1 ketohydroxyglutarate aldolase [Noviherbaspirillum sp. Root189]
MKKLNILQQIVGCKLIAIVRSNSSAAALATAEACIEGGATTIEVAFTTPDALDVIKTLVDRHHDQALIGAGTVLDAETARMAILAGAGFLLAPNLNVDVIRVCNRYQVVSIPGISTPSEAVQALESGADFLKVFPSEIYGPEYFKALKAPLPHAPLIPSGGVSLNNVDAWFQHGAVAVSAGSSLTGPGAHGDYAAVTENARKFVAAVSRS